MQRPISRSIRLLFLVLVTAGISVPAIAEEDAAKDPFAALPAPAEEYVFTEAMTLRRGPAALGRVELKVAVEAGGGKAATPTWQVRDGISPVKGVQGADLAIASARLDERLIALEGSYRRTNRLGFLRSSWARTKKGYTFEQRTQEFENLLPAKGAADARSTLAGLLLFLRLAGDFQGEVRFHDLDPDPEPGEELVAPVTLRVEADVAWRLDDAVTQARVATWTRGQVVRYIAVHPKDGRCLGVVVRGMDVSLTPKDVTRVGLADPASAASSPLDDARTSTAQVRAELPPGTTPFSFEGDLVLDGWRLGRVAFKATPVQQDGKAAWRIEEQIIREAGAARVLQERKALLAQDLTVLEGSTRIEAPAGKISSRFQRTKDGIEVRFPKSKALVASDPTATFGLFPIVRFLMHAPETATRYTLPGFDPRFSRTPKTGSGRLPVDMADAVIDVEGPSQWSSGRELVETFAALVRLRIGQRYRVHLSRDRTRLVAIEGVFPLLDYLPTDEVRKAPSWFDDVGKDATTALHAFIKFGRGYHLPDRKLLAEAFHWPSMLKAEVAAGSWPTDTALEDFREAWIQEFVTRSKNRTRGDCDDLLMQILMTGSEEWHADGSMTLTSIPTYGGHSYRLQEVDGVWRIIKID